MAGLFSLFDVGSTRVGNLGRVKFCKALLIALGYAAGSRSTNSCNFLTMKTFLRTAAVITVVLSPAQAREPADYGRYTSSAVSGDVVLVNWNSLDGRARLARASHREDFYQLAHHYQPQANALYCGIASSVIVLNGMRAGRRAIPSQAAMEVRIPPPWGGGTIPYPLYTQASFLNDDTDRVKPRAVIEFKAAATNGKPDPGLTLQELRGMFDAYGAAATAYHADAPEREGLPRFREHVQRTLGEPDRFLIINYDSRALGQAGGGHISPLAAYDAESDSLLVLDVSGHLNPWFWVPLRELYLAMHTKDGARFRGWVIVGERNQGTGSVSGQGSSEKRL